ncbi:Short-chain dehydrogenase/reductase SDR [Trinorchestia longiramus]|nr:Short-chain dehydrogenase/reductase SDR [Trinorchestia longiramus]
MAESCPKPQETCTENAVVLKDGSTPSIIHSVPWLLGWVWLSIVGPVLAMKLFANVGRALFKKYLWRKESLAGKVVLITGASSGVGEAVARLLYCEGCRLILAARSVDKLNVLKQQLIAGCETPVVQEPIVLELDISDLRTAPDLVKAVVERVGRVDILINNAGQSSRGAAMDTLLDVDLKLMLVNYFGHVAVTKAVLPAMIEARTGHIISVSSLQGRLAIPYRSSYCASKHALQGFMDSLRAEVAAEGIKVSVVSPGYIATNLSLNAVTASGNTYGVMDATTAGGMAPAMVAQHILSVIRTGAEDTLLCSWPHRLAVGFRFWAPSLLRTVMAHRARTQAHLYKQEDTARNLGSSGNISPDLATADVASKKQV